jgi:hypothetical protein
VRKKRTTNRRWRSRTSLEWQAGADSTKGFGVSFYRRDTDFVVVLPNGGDGLYFAVEPIVRVAPAQTVNQLMEESNA